MMMISMTPGFFLRKIIASILIKMPAARKRRVLRFVLSFIVRVMMLTTSWTGIATKSRMSRGESSTTFYSWYFFSIALDSNLRKNLEIKDGLVGFVIFGTAAILYF